MERQTRPSGDDAAALGLGSVLVGSLPAALLTDEAPDRYTVEAVFTRRPLREEAAAILDDRTHERLVARGYPDVTLAISDRRLEIAHTSLEELRDGLAGAIADRLAEIDGEVRARQDADAVRLRAAAAEEHARMTTVTALAASIAFHRSDPPHAPAHAPEDAEADRAGIDAWTGEGGHARTR